MGTRKETTTEIDWAAWKKYNKNKLMNFAKTQHGMNEHQATSYANIVLRYKTKRK